MVAEGNALAAFIEELIGTDLLPFEMLDEALALLEAWKDAAA